MQYTCICEDIMVTVITPGKIPLRQLVYRVLDLPPSMRPLVYDFGQLNNSTEKDYTTQIVRGRCSDIENVRGRSDIIEAVSHVLAWSQAYMRDRKVYCACSFCCVSIMVFCSLLG